LHAPVDWITLIKGRFTGRLRATSDMHFTRRPRGPTDTQVSQPPRAALPERTGRPAESLLDMGISAMKIWALDEIAIDNAPAIEIARAAEEYEPM